MWALGIIGGLIFLFFVIEIIIFLIVFYSPTKKQNDIFNIPRTDQYDVYRETMIKNITKLSKFSCEEIYIKSYDGLSLYGRYYHVSDGAPLEICFHGYRGTAERDMNGGFNLSQKIGHNVLLCYQRAHGKSGGHTLTFGIKERFDVVSWARYATERFGKDTKILIVGVSMGAATVLMASGEKLPDTVKGILADCPYSKPDLIIKKVCKEIKCPPKIFYPLISLSARMFGRFSLTEVSAEEQVKKATVPIMVIHGDEDRVVPCEMSESIEKNSPLVERHVFKGAGHALCFYSDNEKYQKIVGKFKDKCLK
ncbi:MAG: alpha/beta hydrolase [Clostridia bacterium]|nr:alpha/beta hydrolase [Clostridia bacterium]